MDCLFLIVTKLGQISVYADKITKFVLKTAREID